MKLIGQLWHGHPDRSRFPTGFNDAKKEVASQPLLLMFWLMAISFA